MENILTVLNNLADQNDPVSQNTLGLLYKEGKGVKRDTHLANQYFVKGVMNDLGLSYYFGDGIKKNFKLAEKYIYQTDKYSDQSKYNFLLKLFDKAEIINIKEF